MMWAFQAIREEPVRDFAVTSLNINGIRAGARKGFFDWLQARRPEVVCLQEIKAQEHQLDKALFLPEGYHRYLHPAEKPGYSGVAIYSSVEPDAVQIGLGWDDFDNEGRFIRADFGNVSVASLYLPSGSAKDSRQDYKMMILDRLLPLLKQWQQDGREHILCGDWNIAHKKIDIKNWRGNQKNSGFLPEERAWLDQLFDELGWVDGFRRLNQQEHEYTWWSNRGQAWANNTGWRIDYQVVTPGIAERLSEEEIYREQRFSDHAPLTLRYQGELA
jgi:exodeoxyribonuclease-3